MKRRNISWLKNAVRQKYAWPGGYHIAAMMEDGVLCMECVRKYWKPVCHDSLFGIRDCWRVVRVAVLLDRGNHCDYCGECLDAQPDA